MNFFKNAHAGRSIFLFLCFAQLPLLTLAQLDTLTFDSTFLKKRHGDFRINFSNVGLSNWAGGGQDALSLGTEFDYQVATKKHKKVFDMDLSLVYGVTKVEGFQGFRKTDDQLNFRTLHGQQIGKRSYLTFLAEFWTQMTNGFEYEDSDDGEMRRLVSRPLAPGYLNTNIGYTIKKQKHYSLTVSPLTSKLTVVLEDSLASAGAFGVDPGKNVRFEGGTGLNGNYTTELMKNIVFKTALTLFSSYDNPTVDVNMRSSIKMKVNDYISSGISIALIYDEDVEVLRDDGSVGTAWQFRNVINAGLSLKI